MERIVDHEQPGIGRPYPPFNYKFIFVLKQRVQTVMGGIIAEIFHVNHYDLTEDVS